MKALLKKFGLTTTQAVQYSGIAAVVIVLIVIITSARGSVPKPGSFVAVSPGMPFMEGGVGGGYEVQEAAYDSYNGDYDSASGYSKAARLSVANIAPVPMPYGSVGDDGEDFEVTQYHATFETHKKDRLCNEVLSLKTRPEVVFESSNMYERGCDFSFKVARPSVQEVLSALRGWNPRELNENMHTIQKEVNDFTSEQEILERKLVAIDETLESSLAAYDDITALATKTENADALTRIIDSRVSIIERLTQERISINAQLDRLSRAKAEELDKLVYTYFSVSVYENRFLDPESIKDSWKEALRMFVFEINATIQDLTVGLMSSLFILIQYLVYLAILLVVAKFGWRYAKEFWNS
ncbi:MAG: hypothetical protein KBE09_03635 [Candidatus Pacebacteria bacterium]|nr:hypothetical protein [Candidatus Paceibacterota bacterium]